MSRTCGYSIAPLAPQLCEGPWWMVKGYFIKGRDRNLYACEKHAKWRMQLGMLTFMPVPVKKKKS